ncbi:YybH family protein [Hyphomonas johnsonii]|uniref:Putative lipoprotein n=1 Tax=Hyphomonas johnsonii MHS-2 TaxID=1280950 RepID=A0A059FJI8_9PROT|nr:nuclear transport factor 2 family protein [Hyphomonas johnsonii]KCZ90633.1 putative lipoprotein [Hyphomonas johnsonii MHS-2]
MKSLAAAILLAASLAACASPAPATAPPVPATAAADAEIAAITAVLDAQDAAWNRGDIDAFMAGYWHSPDLRFASGGTVTRGWEGTNQRYHTRYATPELMGRLDTSDYEIVLLAPDAAIAHGAWRLDRAGDTPSGLYTLVMRKIEGAWLIVSDTTTSAD